jgi:V8-like Glu-specific endopeptidase
MRKRSIVVAALAAFVGCESSDQLESVDHSIVAGAVDPGDPAVVEFLAIMTNSVSKCTATLVTPRILLTAGHCVAETKGAAYSVYLGNDDSKIRSRTELLAVSATAYDPQFGDPTQGHDLAVAVLAKPVSIKPIPINRASIANATDKIARYVGYGLTDGVAGTGSGIKRQASAPIDLVTKLLIGMGQNKHLTCNGDSGGPLFMDNGSGSESIIGVTSFGDETCVKDGFFMRMDTQMEWVDQQIKKYDPNGEPGLEDAGAPADAEVAPTPPDARPDTMLPIDTRPASPPDARPPTPDAARADKPRADAGLPRSLDAEADPEPELETMNGAQSAGGCSCAVAAGASGGAPAALACGAFLLIARWGARRRRTRTSSRSQA